MTCYLYDIESAVKVLTILWTNFLTTFNTYNGGLGIFIIINAFFIIIIIMYFLKVLQTLYFTHIMITLYVIL